MFRLTAYVSIWCVAIAEVGDNGEYHIWNPCSQHWWHVGVDCKSRRHRLQHDVAETERQAYTERETHSALALP